MIYKNKTMTKTTRKIISTATVFCFVMTQNLFASPGMGIEIASPREAPSFLQIDIPAELATLDGLYEAPFKTDPKMILHIQNAHANYGAQQKIKELLQYLEKTYAIKTIFVEGASEDLDPDYLKMFPDRERNLKLADYLAKQGELTGAELYLLENQDSGGRREEGGKPGLAPSAIHHPSSTASATPKAHGIEDAALYRENYEALKKVFGAEATVNRYLEGFEGRMGTLASKVFSKDLFRFLGDWKKFEKGHREFMPYVRTLTGASKQILGIDFESLLAQIEWPQITRLLVLQTMEKELDMQKGIAERDQLIAFLKGKQVSASLITAIENFRDQRVSMLRAVNGGAAGPIQPRDLMEQLVKEAGPKGFYFHNYPNFSLYAGYLILKNELDPKGLFAEIQVLFKRLLDQLAQTPREKQLLELYRNEELVRKLLNLELTRKDWQEVLARKDLLAMDSLVAELKEIGTAVSREAGLPLTNFETKPVNPKFRGEVTEVQEAAYGFYDAARRRESVFYEKITSVMAKDSLNKAVVITGGFHTDGMTDLFQEHEVSYGVLTPRLMEKSDEKMYRSVMLQNKASLFELSYLEAALRLLPPGAYEAQVGEKELMQSLDAILRAVGYAGDFGAPAQAIEVVNGSIYAKAAGIQIKATTRTNKQGRPIYQVIRTAKPATGISTPATSKVAEQISTPDAGKILATTPQIKDALTGMAGNALPATGAATVAAAGKLAEQLSQVAATTGEVTQAGEVKAPEAAQAEAEVQEAVSGAAKRAEVREDVMAATVAETLAATQAAEGKLDSGVENGAGLGTRDSRFKNQKQGLGTSATEASADKSTLGDQDASRLMRPEQRGETGRSEEREAGTVEMRGSGDVSAVSAGDGDRASEYLFPAITLQENPRHTMPSTRSEALKLQWEALTGGKKAREEIQRDLRQENNVLQANAMREFKLDPAAAESINKLKAWAGDSSKENEFMEEVGKLARQYPYASFQVTSTNYEAVKGLPNVSQAGYVHGGLLEEMGKNLYQYGGFGVVISGLPLSGRTGLVNFSISRNPMGSVDPTKNANRYRANSDGGNQHNFLKLMADSGPALIASGEKFFADTHTNRYGEGSPNDTQKKLYDKLVKKEEVPAPEPGRNPTQQQNDLVERNTVVSSAQDRLVNGTFMMFVNPDAVYPVGTKEMVEKGDYRAAAKTLGDVRGAYFFNDLRNYDKVKTEARQGNAEAFIFLLEVEGKSIAKGDPVQIDEAVKKDLAAFIKSVDLSMFEKTMADYASDNAIWRMRLRNDPKAIELYAKWEAGGKQEVNKAIQEANAILNVVRIETNTRLSDEHQYLRGLLFGGREVTIQNLEERYGKGKNKDVKVTTPALLKAYSDILALRMKYAYLRSGEAASLAAASSARSEMRDAGDVSAVSAGDGAMSLFPAITPQVSPAYTMPKTLLGALKLMAKAILGGKKVREQIFDALRLENAVLQANAMREVGLDPQAAEAINKLRALVGESDKQVEFMQEVGNLARRYPYALFRYRTSNLGRDESGRIDDEVKGLLNVRYAVFEHGGNIEEMSKNLVQYGIQGVVIEGIPLIGNKGTVSLSISRNGIPNVDPNWNWDRYQPADNNQNQHRYLIVRTSESPAMIMSGDSFWADTKSQQYVKGPLNFAQQLLLQWTQKRSSGQTAKDKLVDGTFMMFVNRNDAYLPSTNALIERGDYRNAYETRLNNNARGLEFFNNIHNYDKVKEDCNRGNLEAFDFLMKVLSRDNAWTYVRIDDQVVDDLRSFIQKYDPAVFEKKMYIEAVENTVRGLASFNNPQAKDLFSQWGASEQRRDVSQAVEEAMRLLDNCKLDITHFTQKPLHREPESQSFLRNFIFSDTAVTLADLDSRYGWKRSSWNDKNRKYTNQNLQNAYAAILGLREKYSYIRTGTGASFQTGRSETRAASGAVAKKMDSGLEKEAGLGTSATNVSADKSTVGDQDASLPGRQAGMRPERSGETGRSEVRIESQGAIAGRITEQTPRHRFVKDAPTLGYRITSGKPEDLPEAVRGLLGKMDATNYADLTPYIGSIVNLQMADAASPDFYPVGTGIFTEEYVPSSLEEVAARNGEYLKRVSGVLGALMEKGDPNLVAVLKTVPEPMVKMSEIGYPVAEEVLISVERGTGFVTQSKPAGRDAYLAHDGKQWYMINLDDRGLPASYVPARSEVREGEGVFEVEDLRTILAGLETAREAFSMVTNKNEFLKNKNNDPRRPDFWYGLFKGRTLTAEEKELIAGTVTAAEDRLQGMTLTAEVIEEEFYGGLILEFGKLMPGKTVPRSKTLTMSRRRFLRIAFTVAATGAVVWGLGEAGRFLSSWLSGLNSREDEALNGDLDALRKDALKITNTDQKNYMAHYIDALRAARESEEALYPGISAEEKAQRVLYMATRAVAFVLSENPDMRDNQVGGGPAVGHFQAEPQTIADTIRMVNNAREGSRLYPAKRLLEKGMWKESAVYDLIRSAVGPSGNTIPGKPVDAATIGGIINSTDIKSREAAQFLIFRLMSFTKNMEPSAEEVKGGLMQNLGNEVESYLAGYNTAFSSETMMPRNEGEEDASMEVGLSISPKITAAYLHAEWLVNGAWLKGGNGTLEDILSDKNRDAFEAAYRKVESDLYYVSNVDTRLVQALRVIRFAERRGDNVQNLNSKALEGWRSIITIHRQRLNELVGKNAQGNMDESVRKAGKDVLVQAGKALEALKARSAEGFGEDAWGIIQTAAQDQYGHEVRAQRRILRKLDRVAGRLPKVKKESRSAAGRSEARAMVPVSGMLTPKMADAVMTAAIAATAQRMRQADRRSEVRENPIAEKINDEIIGVGLERYREEYPGSEGIPGAEAYKYLAFEIVPMTAFTGWAQGRFQSDPDSKNVAVDVFNQAVQSTMAGAKNGLLELSPGRNELNTSDFFILPRVGKMGEVGLAHFYDVIDIKLVAGASVAEDALLITKIDPVYGREVWKVWWQDVDGKPEAHYELVSSARSEIRLSAEDLATGTGAVSGALAGSGLWGERAQLTPLQLYRLVADIDSNPFMSRQSSVTLGNFETLFPGKGEAIFSWLQKQEGFYPRGRNSGSLGDLREIEKNIKWKFPFLSSKIIAFLRQQEETVWDRSAIEKVYAQRYYENVLKDLEGRLEAGDFARLKAVVNVRSHPDPLSGKPLWYVGVDPEYLRELEGSDAVIYDRDAWQWAKTAYAYLSESEQNLRRFEISGNTGPQEMQKDKNRVCRGLLQTIGVPDTVSKARLLDIPEVRDDPGSIFNPENPNGIWSAASSTEVRLREDLSTDIDIPPAIESRIEPILRDARIHWRIAQYLIFRPANAAGSRFVLGLKHFLKEAGDAVVEKREAEEKAEAALFEGGLGKDAEAKAFFDVLARQYQSDGGDLDKGKVVSQRIVKALMEEKIDRKFWTLFRDPKVSLRYGEFILFYNELKERQDPADLTAEDAREMFIRYLDDALGPMTVWRSQVFDGSMKEESLRSVMEKGLVSDYMERQGGSADLEVQKLIDRYGVSRVAGSSVFREDLPGGELKSEGQYVRTIFLSVAEIPGLALGIGRGYAAENQPLDVKMGKRISPDNTIALYEIKIPRFYVLDYMRNPVMRKVSGADVSRAGLRYKFRYFRDSKTGQVEKIEAGDPRSESLVWGGTIRPEWIQKIELHALRDDEGFRLSTYWDSPDEENIRGNPQYYKNPQTPEVIFMRDSASPGTPAVQRSEMREDALGAAVAAVAAQMKEGADQQRGQPADPSRRRFLKNLGAATLGVAVGMPVFGQGVAADPSGDDKRRRAKEASVSSKVDVGKLAELASRGDYQAVHTLLDMAEGGHVGAQEAVKNLASDFYVSSLMTSQSLVDLAILARLAQAGNPYALDFLASAAAGQFKYNGHPIEGDLNTRVILAILARFGNVTAQNDPSYKGEYYGEIFSDKALVQKIAQKISENDFQEREKSFRALKYMVYAGDPFSLETLQTMNIDKIVQNVAAGKQNPGLLQGIYAMGHTKAPSADRPAPLGEALLKAMPLSELVAYVADGRYPEAHLEILKRIAAAREGSSLAEIQALDVTDLIKAAQEKVSPAAWSTLMALALKGHIRAVGSLTEIKDSLRDNIKKGVNVEPSIRMLMDIHQADYYAALQVHIQPTTRTDRDLLKTFYAIFGSPTTPAQRVLARDLAGSSFPAASSLCPAEDKKFGIKSIVNGFLSQPLSVFEQRGPTSPWANSGYFLSHFDRLADCLKKAEPLDIEYTGRFTLEQLEEIIRNREQNPSDNRKLVIGLYTKDDWNNAMSNAPFEFDECPRDKYRMMYYELNTIEEMKAYLKEASKETTVPASIITFNFHGWQEGMNLGKESFLLSNEKEFRDAGVAEALMVGGIIKLNSCSTGKGREEADNIANMMRRLFPNAKPKGIYAPTRDGTGSFEFDDNGNVIRVVYNGPETYQALIDEFHPEFIQNYADAGKPGALGEATLLASAAPSVGGDTLAAVTPQAAEAAGRRSEAREVKQEDLTKALSQETLKSAESIRLGPDRGMIERAEEQGASAEAIVALVSGGFVAVGAELQSIAAMITGFVSLTVKTLETIVRERIAPSRQDSVLPMGDLPGLVVDVETAMPSAAKWNAIEAILTFNKNQHYGVVFLAAADQTFQDKVNSLRSEVRTRFHYKNLDAASPSHVLQNSVQKMFAEVQKGGQARAYRSVGQAFVITAAPELCDKLGEGLPAAVVEIPAAIDREVLDTAGTAMAAAFSQELLGGDKLSEKTSQAIKQTGRRYQFNAEGLKALLTKITAEIQGLLSIRASA